MQNNKLDILWDDNPVDITQEANFIWSIANKLRGVYMPDKYGDVVIPMVVLRRFECALEPTKEAVIKKFEENPTYPVKAMYKISGYQFYNTSHYNLKELCNDADHIAENLKAYVNGFSKNIQEIMSGLEFDAQIEKMRKGKCLYTVIKAFSELDLSPATVDSIKMGYIFENLIGRFFQNVDQGQFYTGRDLIKLAVSLLISEGCEDIFEDGKVITLADYAAGSGGMLSTFYSYMKHYNPNCNIKLFGQEYNPVSHAIGLAEMLIKGQDAENFRNADTFKEDCFADVKMRFGLMNSPFGTPWSGKDAKEGQEDAVRKEFAKGLKGRWGAGLPGGGDSQLIFMQAIINKLTSDGRAALFANGSPLFIGGTASGESQIRRWLLENDLIEAIVGLPVALFYNTSIVTYIFLISKNKRPERKGKVQLIDASKICHKLRKPLGCKRNEITPEDRLAITNIYLNFENTEESKIYDNEDFMYREYTVMQPLQRAYSITDESIESMLSKGSLSSLYDESKVYELENSAEELSVKDQKKLDDYNKNKPVYDKVLELLKSNTSDKKYLSKEPFEAVLNNLLGDVIDKKLIAKVVDGLSQMDKEAKIQRDKKGNIIWDKETKDTELVPYKVKIDDYMEDEVLPHVPDARAFFEGKDEENTFEMDLGEKTVRIGAEIPFTRYFYKYQQPTPSDELLKKFIELDNSINQQIKELMSND